MGDGDVKTTISPGIEKFNNEKNYIFVYSTAKTASVLAFCFGLTLLFTLLENDGSKKVIGSLAIVSSILCFIYLYAYADKYEKYKDNMTKHETKSKASTM